MPESKKTSGEGMVPKKTSTKPAKEKSLNKKTKVSGPSSSQSGEVLFNVLGFQYRLPGKQQRIVIASVVLGLNVLLVLFVLLYFYNPSFKEFIFNFGRT